MAVSVSLLVLIELYDNEEAKQHQESEVSFLYDIIFMKAWLS